MCFCIVFLSVLVGLFFRLEQCQDWIVGLLNWIKCPDFKCKRTDMKKMSRLRPGMCRTEKTFSTLCRTLDCLFSKFLLLETFCWKSAAKRRWTAPHNFMFYQSHSVQEIYILYLHLLKLKDISDSQAIISGDERLLFINSDLIPCECSPLYLM